MASAAATGTAGYGHGLVTAASASRVAILSPSPSSSAHQQQPAAAQQQQQQQTVRVLLYQRSTGLLQTSLTARLKESHNQQRQEVVGLFLVEDAADQDHVVLVYRNEWIAWDLARGVVAYHHQHQHHSEDAVDALDACVYDRRVYLLVGNSSSSSKLRIHEHELESGKLVRKIKAGGSKGGDGASQMIALRATEEHLVLRQSETIRVLNRRTGSKVKKVHLPPPHDDEGDKQPADGPRCPLAVGGGSLIAAATASGRVVAVDWNCPKQRKQEWAPSRGGPFLGAAVSLEFLSSSDGGDDNDWTLLVAGGGGGAMLLHGSDTSSSIRETKIVVPSSSSVERWSVVTTTTQSSSRRSSAELVAVLGKDQRYQIQTVEAAISSNNDDDDDNISNEIIVSWIEKAAATKEEDTKEKKKRSRDNATILGPGQAGASSSSHQGVSEQPVMKKSRSAAGEGEEKDVMDQDEEEEDNDGAPTIAERLAKLRQALEEEDSDVEDEDKDEKEEQVVHFQPKQATTESLTQLLHQSLQSGDDALLELALQVRDGNVVRSSCAQLDESDVPVLFSQVTARLAQKPARADALVAWIVALLQTSHMTSLPHLQALQNLLQERVQVFPDLLKLQGRLSMMSSSGSNNNTNTNSGGGNDQ